MTTTDVARLLESRADSYSLDATTLRLMGELDDATFMETIADELTKIARELS